MTQNAAAAESQSRKRRPRGPLPRQKPAATSAETTKAAGTSTAARPRAAGLSKSAGFQPASRWTNAVRNGSTVVAISSARCAAGLSRRRSRPRTARTSASPAQKVPKPRPVRNAVSFAQNDSDCATAASTKNGKRRLSR